MTVFIILFTVREDEQISDMVTSAICCFCDMGIWQHQLCTVIIRLMSHCSLKDVMTTKEAAAYEITDNKRGKLLVNGV